MHVVVVGGGNGGMACGARLAMVSAFTVFCVVSFSQLVPALLLVSAFYLLARTIERRL